MVARMVRSAVLHGLIWALFGVLLTLLLHGFTGVRYHQPFYAPHWYAGEPQWFGVALTYGAAGAALRWMRIEVFGQPERMFALLPATATNTGYKSAILANAAVIVLMLLLYKLLIVDIQLDAADRFAPGMRNIKTELSANLFAWLLPSWFGAWPVNFYLFALVAAAIGGLAGFLERADERNEFLALVVPAWAALAFVITAFIGMAITMFAFIPDLPPAGQPYPPYTPPLGIPPRAISTAVLFVIPSIAAVLTIIYRLSPTGRKRRPNKLFIPPKTIGERYREIAFGAEATGKIASELFALIVNVAFFGIGPWLFILIAQINPAKDWVWAVLALAVNVFLIVVCAKSFGQLWRFFVRPTARLDPNLDLYGKTKGPSDDDIKRGLGD